MALGGRGEGALMIEVTRVSGANSQVMPPCTSAASAAIGTLAVEKVVPVFWNVSAVTGSMLPNACCHIAEACGVRTVPFASGTDVAVRKPSDE